MPAQHTYGTAGATGGGFANFKGLQPMFREERIDVRPDWSWQRRSACARKDPTAWASRWPRGAFGLCGNDGAAAYAAVGSDYSGAQGYEPFSCDGAGTQTRNRIVGQCLDSVSAPVANAIVQGFVTATDAYVGEVTAAADGTYALMTEQLTSVAHYLVAYKAGAPDIAGTTVNTILPVVP